jgi:hypothetical protein
MVKIAKINESTLALASLISPSARKVDPHVVEQYHHSSNLEQIKPKKM